MTTIMLKINERTNKGKYLIGLIKELSKNDADIEIVEGLKPNRKTLKAIEDVEQHKGTRVKNSEELFRKLGI